MLPLGYASPMLRRLLVSLALRARPGRLFDLPSWHPDRMIAAQLTLYIGLAIILAVTCGSTGTVEARPGSLVEPAYCSLPQIVRTLAIPVTCSGVYPPSWCRGPG